MTWGKHLASDLGFWSHIWFSGVVIMCIGRVLLSVLGLSRALKTLSYLDVFRLTKCLSFSSPRPEKLVWHGSSTVGIRLTTNYCEAWRTADMAVTGQAALLQTGRLLGQHTHSCSNHYIVLCIENTYVGNTHQRRTWRNRENTHTHEYT